MKKSTRIVLIIVAFLLIIYLLISAKIVWSFLEFNNYDKAIIVSGDGDFHCLIEYLVEHNKLYRILTPNQKYSSLLRKYHDYIARIDLQRKKLEWRKSK